MTLLSTLRSTLFNKELITKETVLLVLCILYTLPRCVCRHLIIISKKRLLPTAVPVTLTLALQGVSIATVAVQVKLNEPSSLKVTVLPLMTTLLRLLNA